MAIRRCIFCTEPAGDYASWVLNTRIADYVNNRNIAVVMPSGKNRFYINNEYGRKFYTYITEELVSQCEEWFDISRNAEDRYIAGMSMADMVQFMRHLRNRLCITPHLHIQDFLTYLSVMINRRE